MKVQPWILKRQVWSLSVASAAAMTVVSLVLLKPAWVLICGFVTIASWWTTRVWTNRDPIPLPHAMGWALLAPRPFQSSRRLKELLGLHGGERLLEVGPGTGKYTLPIASSLGSGGTLEVLDIQQEMLDHLMRRASRAVIANIVPTMGDATRLPYPDDRFDGAYLITVLGEIPDKDAALQDLRRVLKPDGCLVIGEIFFDPDFIPLADLQRHLGRRGFAFKRKTGPWWAYLARFDKT